MEIALIIVLVLIVGWLSGVQHGRRRAEEPRHIFHEPPRHPPMRSAPTPPTVIVIDEQQHMPYKTEIQEATDPDGNRVRYRLETYRLARALPLEASTGLVRLPSGWHGQGIEDMNSWPAGRYLVCDKCGERVSPSTFCEGDKHLLAYCAGMIKMITIGKSNFCPACRMNVYFCASNCPGRVAGWWER